MSDEYKPELSEYLAHIWEIKSVNHAYRSLVRNWFRSYCRHEYYADLAMYYDGVDDEIKYRAADKKAEFFFDAYHFIEERLPKREVKNAYRQLKNGLRDEPLREASGVKEQTNDEINYPILREAKI